MKNSVRALVGFAVVVATVTTAPVGAAAPPKAISTPRVAAPSTSSTITSGVHVVAGATIRAVSPNGVIDCHPSADNPHGSTHVGGTMNVVGHVTCTGTVAYISASVDLRIASNSGIIASKTSRSTGKSFWQDNAATICSPGQYYGYVQFQVNYPPNYNPPVGYGMGGGPTATVTC